MCGNCCRLVAIWFAFFFYFLSPLTFLCPVGLMLTSASCPFLFVSPFSALITTHKTHILVSWMLTTTVGLLRLILWFSLPHSSQFLACSLRATPYTLDSASLLPLPDLTLIPSPAGVGRLPLMSPCTFLNVSSRCTLSRVPILFPLPTAISLPMLRAILWVVIPSHCHYSLYLTRNWTTALTLTSFLVVSTPPLVRGFHNPFVYLPCPYIRSPRLPCVLSLLARCFYLVRCRWNISRPIFGDPDRRNSHCVWRFSPWVIVSCYCQSINFRVTFWNSSYFLLVYGSVRWATQPSLKTG